ncbi:MAG: SLBB domain-containing protein [Streptococcaceae bacterium]|jgi:Na+-translocating ferredoxin:NAD+ oxidoreductase RnfC subunit|nr:SLBB domain-containing protein [Streptococcaceae bacterium]
MATILKQIEDAGIVGAGGAGFPTAVKFDTQAEYLIVNAAECEPLLKTDHFVMNNHASEVVEAILLVKASLQAKYAVIATKSYYTAEVEALTQAISAAEADIELHLMENFYPAGDEQVMVFEVTGRVVPAAGLPIQVGCVVSNITTMLNVYQALIHNQPVIRKQLTITGAVNAPTLLDVPIGTPFEKCLDAAGGTSLQDYLFIDGGPMMGKIYTQNELADKVVAKTTSGLIIKEDSGYLSKLKHQTLEYVFTEARAACMQCTLCTQLCPRQNLGHEVFPHKVMRYFGGIASYRDIDYNEDSAEILQGAQICCACGICEVIACPMGLSPRQVNLHVKNELAKLGVKYETRKTEYKADPMRDYREVSPNNILIKMGLTKFAERHLTEMKRLDVDEVFIPLRMHIGLPSQPIVKEGDKLNEGDLIAKKPADALGANIHSSISGTVMKVTNQLIHIKA